MSKLFQALARIVRGLSALRILVKLLEAIETVLQDNNPKPKGT